MTLQDTLVRACAEHDLDFLAAVSDEGLTMGQAGERLPSDAFAPYVPMAMETARRLAESGGLGGLACQCMVLESGRLLICARGRAAGRDVYLALMCRKTPRRLNELLGRVARAIGRALGDRSDEGGGE